MLWFNIKAQSQITHYPRNDISIAFAFFFFYCKRNRGAGTGLISRPYVPAKGESSVHHRGDGNKKGKKKKKLHRSSPKRHTSLHMHFMCINHIIKRQHPKKISDTEICRKVEEIEKSKIRKKQNKNKTRKPVTCEKSFRLKHHQV